MRASKVRQRYFDQQRRRGARPRWTKPSSITEDTFRLRERFMLPGEYILPLSSRRDFYRFKLEMRLSCQSQCVPKYLIYLFCLLKTLNTDSNVEGLQSKRQIGHWTKGVAGLNPIKTVMLHRHVCVWIKTVNSKKL